MTTQADFSSEEWTQIGAALVSAGMLISFVSPGMVDAVKESMAMASTIAHKIQANDSGPLLAALLQEFRDKEKAKALQPQFQSKDPATVETTLVDAVTRGAATLKQKATPEEAQEIGGFIYQVAAATANAAKEGDFMGIGGERVNAAEKQALDQIAGIFGLQPAS